MEEWKSNTVMSKHQQPFLLEEQGSFWREIAGLAATNHSCLRTRARETESTRVRHADNGETSKPSRGV